MELNPLLIVAIIIIIIAGYAIGELKRENIYRPCQHFKAGFLF